MYQRKRDNQITPIVVTIDNNIQHYDSYLSQIENAVSLQETDIVSEEMQNKKLKTRNRYNTFKDIIYNTHTSSNNEVPCHVGMYGLLGAIFGVLLNFPLGLITIHNVIENPEYFYEEMLLNFCSLPIWTAQFLICCIYFMNVDCIKTWKHFLKASICLLMILVIQRVVVFLIWTKGAGYPYPMPFHTTLSRFVTIVSAFIVLWRLFDSKWRMNAKFRKRFSFFVMSYLLVFCIHAQYSFWGRIFARISPKFQWVLALTLPALREFDIWIFCKLAYKAAGAVDPSVEIASSFSINTRHGIFLSVILGTAATDLSCWIIFGTDFIINMGFISATHIFILQERKTNSD